jgi:hypothetical protein
MKRTLANVLLILVLSLSFSQVTYAQPGSRPTARRMRSPN